MHMYIIPNQVKINDSDWYDTAIIDTADTS